MRELNHARCGNAYWLDGKVLGTSFDQMPVNVTDKDQWYKRTHVVPVAEFVKDELIKSMIPPANNLKPRRTSQGDVGLNIQKVLLSFQRMLRHFIPFTTKARSVDSLNGLFFKIDQLHRSEIQGQVGDDLLANGSCQYPELKHIRSKSLNLLAQQLKGTFTF